MLQEREVRRVGGNSVISVDVRIIAATNKNLQRQVSEGKFRQDLLYRLNVLRLYIPPLRKRSEDIPFSSITISNITVINSVMKCLFCLKEQRRLLSNMPSQAI